ncbi:RNA-binding protein 33-like [Mya arenaria]|uniref:RNA-binding protein 33-like n=1 Tax=Mya arenaria TaxID=6604 RepID=UPI0022E41B25|nr:RNA-binding protein 33-like [Mya arenaria]
MPRKRPTEASWDSSDDDLLQETSGTSAFSHKKEIADEEIDEDALLGFNHGHQKNTSLADLSSEIEIGLDTSDAIDNQLDYEDEVQDDFEMDGSTEIFDTSAPGNGDQGTFEVTAEENDSDSDDEEKNSRNRFQSERKTVSISSVSYAKSTAIPESLEITEEMQKEIDSFEKKGKGGNFQQKRGMNNQRGGFAQRARGQRLAMNRPILNRLGNGVRFSDPQRGNRQGVPRFSGQRGQMQGNYRPRGPQQGNFGQRGPQQGNFGQRGPQRGNFGLRGPNQEHFGQRGPQQGNFRPPGPVKQEFHPQQGGHLQVFQSPPRGVLPHGPPQHSAVPLLGSPANFPHGPPHHPQPLLPMPIPQQLQPLPHGVPQQQHQQQQHLVPLSQPHQTPPYMNPQTSHPQQPQMPSPGLYSHQVPQAPHSAPGPELQPVYPSVSVPGGASTIHVNPNFSGPLPLDIRPQMAPPASSVQVQYNHPQVSWSGPVYSQAAIPQPGQPQQQVYSQTPMQQYQPPATVMTSQHMQPGLLDTPRPLFGSGPQGSPRPLMQPPQGVNQGPPRHFNPQQQHQGPTRPNNYAQRPQRHPGSQQPNHIQRPGANKNIRHAGPRMQNIRPGQGQGPPRMQTQPQGWNPKPENLANQSEPIDPEKIKKQIELEERKKKRLARFGSSAPVVIKPEVSKVVSLKPSKRHSMDQPETSPAKISRPNITVLDRGGLEAEVGGDKEDDDEDTSHLSDYEKALLDQKKRREAILRQKEEHRLAEANRRRFLLKEKLAREGKTIEDIAKTVMDDSNEETSQVQNIPNVTSRGRGARGQMSNRGQISNRGQNANRGQMSNRGHISNNRGQLSNVGDFNPNEVQTISVLGQGQNTPVTLTRGQPRGRGNFRGQGRGQARSQINFSQLQQVKIEENVDFDVQSTVPVNVNRTVISSSRDLTLDAKGDASQGQGQRIVKAGNQNRVVLGGDESSPKRRIIVDSKPTSASISINGLSKSANLTQINSLCAKCGTVKVFNYYTDERKVEVKFASPIEAGLFLKKYPRVMVDMSVLTCVSIPEI